MFLVITDIKYSLLRTKQNLNGALRVPTHSVKSHLRIIIQIITRLEEPTLEGGCMPLVRGKCNGMHAEVWGDACVSV